MAKPVTKKKKMSAQTKRTLNAVSITALAMLSLMLILRNCDRCKSKCNDAASKVILLDSLNRALPGSVNIVNNNSNTVELSNDVKVRNDVKVAKKARSVKKAKPIEKQTPKVPTAPVTQKAPKPQKDTVVADESRKTEKDTVIVDESRKIEKDTVINGAPCHIIEETKAKEVISNGKRRASLEWNEVITIRVRAVPCKTR